MLKNNISFENILPVLMFLLSYKIIQFFLLLVISDENILLLIYIKLLIKIKSETHLNFLTKYYRIFFQWNFNINKSY